MRRMWLVDGVGRAVCATALVDMAVAVIAVPPISIGERGRRCRFIATGELLRGAPVLRLVREGNDAPYDDIDISRVRVIAENAVYCF